jgi:acyl dehydratase
MEVKELHSSPGMLPMFARAGVAMIPGASHLPWVGGGGKDVPELTLALEDVGVDRDRLAAYDRVCGFDFGDTLPATYPHMLAFPLHLALMTDGRFPFPAIGLVHIYNRIVQHRPLRSSERFSLRVWSSPLEPHPRGTQFAIHSEARVRDELVWEEVSTNLRRGSRGASEDAQAPDVPSAEGLTASATWSLPGDLGRRYGSVSGDLNPIHVHSLSAKLFGFRSAIAHGMWTTARCLAALEPRLPRAYTVEVAFRKPIFLPARVEFALASTKDGMRFGVRDAGKATPHLDGVVATEA